ncbi:MAG: hypothetical protein LBC51_01940 [Treponema sp.]|jgi:predicted lipid-binding transport protein (Tim44 family)|nr:hypothetical protein [Treponema sp.]
MEKAWNRFWKVFGSSLVLILMAGILVGLLSHSVGIIYKVVQGTFAVGLGICGIIGFVVVPAELFFQHKAQHGGPGDAIK